MSLRKAQEKLGKDYRYLSGMIDGMNISVQTVGKAMVISRRDMARIERRIAERRRRTDPEGAEVDHVGSC
jgi:hypothetical protein